MQEQQKLDYDLMYDQFLMEKEKLRRQMAYEKICEKRKVHVSLDVLERSELLYMRSDMQSLIFNIGNIEGYDFIQYKMRKLFHATDENLEQQFLIEYQEFVMAKGYALPRFLFSEFNQEIFAECIELKLNHGYRLIKVEDYYFEKIKATNKLDQSTEGKPKIVIVKTKKQEKNEKRRYAKRNSEKTN